MKKTKLYSLLFVLAALIWIGSLIAVTLVSDAYALARASLDRSSSINERVGNVKTAVLISYEGTEAGGGRSCSILTFLVIGKRGLASVRVSATREQLTAPYQISDINFGIFFWNHPGCRTLMVPPLERQY
ncbi:hypothetical protein OU995_19580 [Roseateles sp. SL47]|uniref:hypothetical protein n=1 Tax=Roseateles sp. SL47 TaxID=2995138 RepID=UPI00226FD61E|nr:hypothetical protein [Roseateles sp. SL47]WAC71769.1 hypothetical protein OU995_19580 [Roseateles sp. SL47]